MLKGYLSTNGTPALLTRMMEKPTHLTVEDLSVKALSPRLCHGGAMLFAALRSISSGMAFAHERFIPHTSKDPLHEGFFQSLNPDMLAIGLRGAVSMAILMGLWSLRHRLNDFVEHRLLEHLRGGPRMFLRRLASFLMDKPVEHPWFKAVDEWVMVFFLRCLALVLIFSANRRALVIPSYPLDPATLPLFQLVQVLLAAAILTQTWLPICGAMILGLFFYQLVAFNWIIAVDMLPVLLVAGVYLSLPWDGWKHRVTPLDQWQIRWIRLVVGVSFFMLGWLKIYNCYLTVGVADNFPAVMDDPLIQLFYLGTSPLYRRECWVIAFAMAEIVTGASLILGVFCRVWCLLLVFMFTKLMVVDFGWAELPHLYFIGIFLVLLFSNHLTTELTWIESRAAQAAQDGKQGRSLFIALGSAVFFAILVVYPGLYVLTRLARPMFLSEALSTW
jgi:uncharacterized membrane protein YphA (DoxX/SURF4 family)